VLISARTPCDSSEGVSGGTIQRVIDRSFYRRKYNAEQVLTGFVATLRSEIDLTQLSEQLLAVVEETMHPAHVSLWLRKPEVKLSYTDL
jgi:hypothetical protein